MRVHELWRYPVKSMLGERLDGAEVGPLGFEGDRRRAVLDAETGVSLSAKRYAELLQCRARTADGQVRIEFPDGSEVPADGPEAAELLSALLDRRVLVRRAGSETVVRHEFPTEIATGAGEPFLHEPGLDAFFDRAPLHLITRATLAEFARRQPGSTFAPARFRPNLLVETSGHGFVEDGWVGRTLRVGAARCEVIDRKPRCVMTTHVQMDLPRDPGVLRTIAGTNGGQAGVELRTVERGTVRVGDPVSVV
ncbi:MAG: MOSC domain-containing protein [Gemmatimonadota bacterium]